MMRRRFLILLALWAYLFSWAMAQEAEDLIRQSIKTRFPSQTPALPEITVNRVLYEKTKIVPLLLKSSPKPQKETLTVGDLEYYATDNGKEMDFYPDGAFTYLNPVAPGEKLLTPSEEQAKSDVNSFLADFGGLPEDAKLYDKGKLQGGTGTADIVLYYFLYSHRYYDVPVETDVIRAVAGGGRIVEFAFSWSTPVKESAHTPVKKSQECYRYALKHYYEKILGGKYLVSATLTDVQLMYYFKSEKAFDTLVPVWRYTFTSPIGYRDLGQKGGAGSKPSTVTGLGRAEIRINALTGDPIQ